MGAAGSLPGQVMEEKLVQGAGKRGGGFHATRSFPRRLPKRLWKHRLASRRRSGVR
jgi:hypothetical protein